MALNIKNAEVEKLAAEAARLTGESKTEAIRRALEDRVSRLKWRGARSGEEQVHNLLNRFRTEFPNGDFGRRMAKAKKEAILGYGPYGV